MYKRPNSLIAAQIASEPDISGDSPDSPYIMGDANPSGSFVGPTK